MKDQNDKLNLSKKIFRGFTRVNKLKMFNNKINLIVVIPLKNIAHTKSRLRKILSLSERKL